jgi:hypothetical protein
MPTPKDQPQRAELPSIDPTALSAVTGGAGDASSMMLPMMMMMRNRQSAAAAPPPPPPQPPKPKILLNGVEQPASALTNSGTGPTFSTTV